MPIIDTMGGLKDYITSKDSSAYDEVHDNTVILNFTHSHLKRRLAEIRLDRHSTISTLKEKLYHHCGTPIDFMELTYCSSDGTPIMSLNEDHRKIGFYSLQHHALIHIQDTNPYSLARNGGLEDVSLVEKYMMTEEEYEKRGNTVRQYKKDQLAKDPTYVPKHLQRPPPPPPATVQDCSHLTVHARCQVQPGSRRGTVSYIGNIEDIGSGGYWIGITLDEPLGKSNGSVKGHSYFKCDDKYGAFVRPMHVELGDFPENEDWELEDEDDEDEL